MKKVVPLARVTLPAEVKQLAHPSCLAPRDGFSRDPNVNTKRYLGQGNSGGGGGGELSRVPETIYINGALVVVL